MTFRLLPVCVFVIAACTAAFADDASHLAKAREYMRVTQAEANSIQTVDAMMGNIQALLKQQRQASTSAEAQAIIDDFQIRASQLIRQTMSWDAMKSDLERITVQTFTEQELDAMIAFYNTPDGRSIAAKTGSFSAKGAAVGQQRAAAILPQIQALAQEMADKMRDAAIRSSTAPAPKAPKK